MDPDQTWAVTYRDDYGFWDTRGPFSKQEAVRVRDALNALHYVCHVVPAKPESTTPLSPAISPAQRPFLLPGPTTR